MHGSATPGSAVADAVVAASSEVQLTVIGAADELRLGSLRQDGSLRPGVTVWVARVGDDLVVRSGSGRGNGWSRRALERREVRVEAGGLSADVRFEEVDPRHHAEVDDAHHRKYDRNGARRVDPVVSEEAASATLRAPPPLTALSRSRPSARTTTRRPRRGRRPR